MKAWLLTIVLLVLPMQQPEPYPGQREHKEPPAGWMCEPQNIDLSVPADHACNCERMYDEETKRVIEDQHCSTWCWPAHCSCHISNSQAMPK